jgi:hypothetical protein
LNKYQTKYLTICSEFDLIPLLTPFDSVLIELLMPVKESPDGIWTALKLSIIISGGLSGI